MNESILVVIPCRNESKNLHGALESISLQSQNSVKSVLIVENNSIDSTFEVATSLTKISWNFDLTVISLSDIGNLKTGVEFEAFVKGANYLLNSKSGDLSHVMKLDADVRLDTDYFQNIFQDHIDFSLCGGRLPGEQKWNVPGCVKLYNLESFKLISDLPRHPGWDVMDEVLLRSVGKNVIYCGKAKFNVVRETGGSEGRYSGRNRLGKICKVVGYPPLYFILKFLRYLLIRPYVFGALTMAFGYLTMKKRPFDRTLTKLYSRELNQKFKRLVRNPKDWLSVTYRDERNSCLET